VNVFIIAAPFQILNAIEAIHHFDFTNNTLIILHTGMFSKNNYEKMIDRSYWNAVTYVDFLYLLTDRDFGKNRPRNPYERYLELSLTFDQFLKRRRINKLCKSLGNVENLLLGNYLNDYDLHMRHFANKINFEKLYLLDVGTDTLRISRQRVRENCDRSEDKIKAAKTVEANNTSNEPSQVKRIKRKLRKALIDWNATGVDSLTYFSCYDLEFNGKDHIIKNDYNYLKSVVHNTVSTDDVLFIGQPLVDQEYLTLETFLELMEKIKTYFNGKQLYYVPHPRESEQYIAMIRDQIGIKIKKFDVVIEFEVTFGGRKPSCIASFFSSAIENCSAIFGNTIGITSFYLPAEVLLKDIESVGEVYSYLSANDQYNINVVSLF
jgi:hypothetical protein